jgi:hypothetical protein
MDTRFVANHLAGAQDCDRVMIPGLCKGDPGLIAQAGVSGPRPESLKDIPTGSETRHLEGYGAYRTKILGIVDAYQIA